ncbi:uncharacterized protein PITG_21005 [Phytophthora infestans T30-4]|uniref:Uncharacterized protein n=1 Tax=Phytophthora infestans (strain T30-4) TaxID=403677 RepID=D0P364_PHYIT|nr:uncharacterized protein PITG_21005 [Phytophthora infestans T30-4]EEY59040.1 conserved hypothetical protein [Phytophthora infestans T30-4]|eukprot:XP_002895254.1 conserved hypothetical protein [Phytophthora infestans T30-4]
MSFDQWLALNDLGRSRTSNRASPRVSPYPQRDRTPPQRLQDEASPATNAASPSAHRTAAQHRLQLVIQPIVKNTIGQRDTSGEAPDVFAVNGATFNDIMRKIWTKFSCRVKRQAVKRDGTWSVEEPLEQAWSKVMQFKSGRHLVDSTKNSQAWNRWIASTRGETVKLMIYQYGLAIAKAQDLEEFLTACIRRVQTDRSGAAAESSLQEVVEELKEIWRATFQADPIVWRMWANNIVRSMDRSTWNREILRAPPDYIARLLRPAGVEVDRHLSSLTRSARLALDCVNASLADNEAQSQHNEVQRQLITRQKERLLQRKSTIEIFLADIPLPSINDVEDPLERIENVEDIDHEE